MEINDELCENIFFEDDKMINMRSKATIFKKYPGLEKYLKEKFPDSDSDAETLYRIKNKCGHGVCCMCGKPVRFNKSSKSYSRYCSAKCQNSDDAKKRKTEQTKEAKYGDKNYNNKEKSRQTCLEKYGTAHYTQTNEFLEKVKKTNKEKYGVEWGLQNDEIKEKGKVTKKEKYNDENYNNRELAEKTTLERYGVKNTKQSEVAKMKEKETCLKRYGVTSYRKTKECTEKIRKTSMEKYGVDNCTKSDEWKRKWYGNSEWNQKRSEKIYDTMKKNKRFLISKPEKIILDFLLSEYPDTIFQYKDKKRYPFKCDFYIPQKDVFIEYNGFWMHGKHSFDKNNEEDLKTLNEWSSKPQKQYKLAIKVWTEMDPMKLEFATKNKLNYIVLEYDDYKDLNKIKQKIEAF